MLVGEDDVLLGMECLVFVCVDESCYDCVSFLVFKGKYDVVNIKFDKIGGLIEVLKLCEVVVVEGFDVMVGCMVGFLLVMVFVVFIV